MLYLGGGSTYSRLLSLAVHVSACISTLRFRQHSDSIHIPTASSTTVPIPVHLQTAIYLFMGISSI